ncbi:hypothetical protein HYS93_03585 [Candidatus Daviesbacteria bacterium]|nr:hypothetical protein [Candidatus Daviesbacteria bacterium]
MVLKYFNPLLNFSVYYLMSGFLILLYLVGLLSFPPVKIIWQILPPILATFIFGTIYDYFETKNLKPSLSTLITGLIIGLVAQFGEQAWKLFLIGLAAVTFKFLIKINGKHIFNPAASGLLFGILALSSFPAWWGGERSPWIFYIFIPWLLLKYKRWAPIVSLLLPLIIFDGLAVLTSGSLLFFTSVMLIEPKTSPYTVREGVIFGLVVGAGYLISTSFLDLDPLIGGLLIGNLTHNRFAIISRRFL